MIRNDKLALLGALAASLVLLGCGKSQPQASAGVNSASSQPTPAPTPSAPGTLPTRPNGAGTPTPLRPAGAIAEGPDAETIALIYYSLAGQTPPIDDWAKQDFQYTSNEFDRSKKTDAALVAYKAKVAFANTVGHMVLPLNSQLSDYDDKYGEFYVDAFSPSTSFSFPYKGSTYKVSFANADQAQHWKLSATDAAHIIERNGGGHSVAVSASVDLVGVQPAADGGTIMAIVKSFTVESTGRHEPLGSVTVTP